MFTNLLPQSEQLLTVEYTDYANGHYLKRFKKDYPGRQWELTDVSIREDLARLRMPNNVTQRSKQIDELKHKGDYWLAKYDFKIAGTKVSTKDSGNRCIVLIDNARSKLDILLIYHKDDLPKNQNETQYIESTLQKQYDLLQLFVEEKKYRILTNSISKHKSVIYCRLEKY